MNSVLIIDASEEMQPVAEALEGSGFVVTHSPMTRVLREPSADTPSVWLFHMLGRSDVPAMRNLLRSPDLPQGTASLLVVRSEQLASLDFSAGFDDLIVYTEIKEEIAARVRRADWLKSRVDGVKTVREEGVRLSVAT